METFKIILTRLKPVNKVQTLGEATVFKGGLKIYSFKTLELPWKENANLISCIPTGKYAVIKRTSPKFGEHFYLTNVPGRDLILIHAGNYNTQTHGCILPGTKFLDINGDFILDVVESKTVMSKLNKLMPKEFYIEII